MARSYVTQVSLEATGIALIVFTSLIAALRLFLTTQQQCRIRWDDGWLLAAYIVFLMLSVLYLVATPTMFKLEDVTTGKVQPYPTFTEDGLFIQKIFFVTTSGLWVSLWCVKFSLMAVYRRLMTGLKHYIRLWWVLVVFCFMVGGLQERIRGD